jgi:hypothetical protein
MRFLLRHTLLASGLSLLLALGASAAECPNGRGWIPPGSQLSYPAPHVLQYRVPAGYAVAFPDGSLAAQTTHTCSCSTSGGCNPVVAPNGNTSCRTATCTDNGCTGVRNGVVIRTTGEAVAFAQARTAQTQPQAVPGLLEIPSVRTAVTAFLHTHNGGLEPPPAAFFQQKLHAPEGYVFTLLDVYGYLATALVHRDVAAVLDAVDAGTITCACAKDKGTGCEKRHDETGVYWCEAGECRECTVSFSNTLLDTTGETETLFGF